MLFKFSVIIPKLLILIIIKDIKYIHTWCTPAGAIGYFLSLLTGRRLILDSFEPHAEPMVESGTWKRTSTAFKLLFKLEKLQLKRASSVISCVQKMEEYSQRKYGLDKQMLAKPACVDFEDYSFDKKKNNKLLDKYDLGKKKVLVYAGKLGGSYLKEEVFDIFKAGVDHYGPDKFRVILLSSQEDEEMISLAQTRNIPKNTIIKKFVSPEEVPLYIGLADMALTPFIPVPSKRYGSPIKTGEYWAMGLPVIITKNISDDSEIVKNYNIGYVLDGLSNKDYRMAFEHIDRLYSDTGKEELPKKIRHIAKKYRSFDIAKTVYRKVYGKG